MSLCGIAGLAIPFIYIAQIPSLARTIALGICALTFLMAGAASVELRRRQVRYATHIVNIGLMLINILAMIANGLNNVGVLLLFSTIPIILSALLAGRRMLILMCSITIVAIGVTALLEYQSPPLAGFAPFLIENIALKIAVSILIISAIGLVLGYYQHALRTMLETIRTSNERMQSELAERMRIEQALRKSEDALRRRNTYLTDLHETTLALMNRLDIADLLQTIVERAMRLLDASRGYLYLYDPDTASIELKVSTGQNHDNIVRRLRMGEGLAGKVWQTGQVLVVNAYDEWPGRADGMPYGQTYAIIGAPLTNGEQIVGVLGLAHGEPDQSFDTAALSLFSGFAQLASIALDNARLYAAAQNELTARTHAISALRESEERYRLIAEYSSDLITLLDNQYRYIYVSPSHSTVLGYAPVSLIGALSLDNLHPDDADAVRKQIARLPGEKVVQTTYRARHADGSWRWIETIWTGTIEEGLNYIITVGRDVTERRRLEVQFLQAQKMEGIGRLAGGVAHDFNNLLTAILSYTELVYETLNPDDPARSDLAEVIGAAQRAAELTRQLLAFARKQVIEPRVINLNDLIESTNKLLRRLIGEDIELTTHLAHDTCLVRADVGQIEQVLINLAVNARDAMPTGGKLIIKTRRLRFHEGTPTPTNLTPGDYVLLTISDTGVGISADIQQRIFEPFFTTKEPGQGTGLGLATSYGIVRQHGGHISFHSDIGRGTTFRIYLPGVNDVQAIEAPRQNISAAPQGSETVLLVEDEPAVRTLASRVLRQHGYTVLEAANGEEALLVLMAWKDLTIDLLLTDVVMPQLGGSALAERVREMHPDIKVLFMSGYTQGALMQPGQLEAHTGFLHKPFSPNKLAYKVRELLDV